VSPTIFVTGLNTVGAARLESVVKFNSGGIGLYEAEQS
jgi:hypothetical protein